jgi:hypothetical protein
MPPGVNGPHLNLRRPRPQRRTGMRGGLQSASPSTAVAKGTTCVEEQHADQSIRWMACQARSQGGMCVTARTSSVWPRKVSRLNPDSLMNILFPGDCSMDSDIGPLAWLSTLAAPFLWHRCATPHSRNWDEGGHLNAARGIGSPSAGAAHAGQGRGRFRKIHSGRRCEICIAA